MPPEFKKKKGIDEGNILSANTSRSNRGKHTRYLGEVLPVPEPVTRERKKSPGGKAGKAVKEGKMQVSRDKVVESPKSNHARYRGLPAFSC